MKGRELSGEQRVVARSKVVGHGLGRPELSTLSRPVAEPGPVALRWPFPAVSGCGAEGCHLGALAPALSGQFPELIPEEHAEDGVGAQAQVGGAQALVERQGALLPPDLHQAVSEARVQLALGTDTGWVLPQGRGALVGTPGSVCVQGLLWHLGKGTPPKLGK